MESYKQTADVIAFIGDFHKKLERLFGDMEKESDNKRVQMLVEYLSRHEKRYADALEDRRYPKNDLLNKTWIQYVPRQEYLNFDGLELSPHMSVEEVVAVALELDDRLIRFFNLLATKSTLPPEVKSAFQGMIKQEEAEKAEIVQIAEDLKNL